MTLQRDIKFTKNKVEGVFADKRKLYILSKNSKIYGYFMLRIGEIEECLTLNEDEPNEEIDHIKNKFNENLLGDVFDLLKDKSIGTNGYC